MIGLLITMCVAIGMGIVTFVLSRMDPPREKRPSRARA